MHVATISRNRIVFLVVLLIYSVSLILCLSYQPLWVDEILQLIGTRSGTLANTQELVRTGVGSVPLGWLPQLVAIHMFGYSAAVARLPSALASIACVWIVIATGRELLLRNPVFAGVLLAVLPLQFRYALEGRPYAQGVMLGALATLVFIRLIKHWSLRLSAVYVLVVVLGMYSQPFVCFIAVSHLAWGLTRWREDKRFAYGAAFALACAALTFIPWYRYASPFWVGTIAAGELHFQLSIKTPLMFLREITGAGYFGGVVVLLLAGIGLRRGTIAPSYKLLLVLSTCVPVLCALATDAVFDYFIAIRQVIFVLPSLVLLAGDGLSTVIEDRPRALAVATAAAAVVFLAYDVHWLVKPREDWQKAAAAVAHLSANQNACSVFAPTEAVSLYDFFEPGLAQNICASSPAADKAIVVAISPYAKQTDRDAAQRVLDGRRETTTMSVGMSTIRLVR